MANMKQRNIIKLVVLMGIFSFLFGCGKKEMPINQPMVPVSKPVQQPKEENKITPIEFPDGVKLTGLHINQQGMMRMPYYMMKVTDTGTYMKISTLSPDDYNMWAGDETEDQEQPAEYFGYIETIKDVEYASLVRLEDETLIRQMEEVIVKYGALGWDGFSEHEEMPGVLDSRDMYDLYLELSDGATVKMHGYNTCPIGFHDLYGEIVDIFEDNSDYSRYLASDFSASPCTLLEVELRDKEYSNVYYKICLRAQNNQWSITLTDPVGLHIEKGTDISDYKEIEEPLPFERFLHVMSKYDVESWNQYEEMDDTTRGRFDIIAYFEDGKEFTAYGNVYPYGFEEFKNEFIKEVYEYYKEVQ